MHTVGRVASRASSTVLVQEAHLIHRMRLVLVTCLRDVIVCGRGKNLGHYSTDRMKWVLADPINYPEIERYVRCLVTIAEKDAHPCILLGIARFRG